MSGNDNLDALVLLLDSLNRMIDENPDLSDWEFKGHINYGYEIVNNFKRGEISKERFEFEMVFFQSLITRVNQECFHHQLIHLRERLFPDIDLKPFYPTIES